MHLTFPVTMKARAVADGKKSVEDNIVIPRQALLCMQFHDFIPLQKEEAGGKMNLVLLHLKENPNISIEIFITYVRKILTIIANIWI
ncbi:hypothetical protein BUALT_Bualt03G0060100 [Buddleja alternifolia]|uniref:Uncharacterized protein n=1 Tax=Buddleja alternifolia TaxID=168488 RepID=A0AAV6XRC8_9LAMI|nr:hypothetical protein BUALT_Bualt03G0060100 [Buddleja alternifolia]